MDYTNWTAEEINLYQQSYHEIEMLYQKRGIGRSPEQRTRFMLKYLNKGLTELPVKKWAKILSFGVFGSHVGLKRLEVMALLKTGDKKEDSFINESR